MLPIACLPLCGILMGIGYLLCPAAMQGGEISGTVPLIGQFLLKAGGALIDHIALLFALGIGVGLSDDQNVYHLFPIFCEKRDELQSYLKENGVGTVIHYPIPPFKQECYATVAWNTPQLVCPITEKIHATELSIPIGPTISEKEANAIIEIINRF